jgi:hypothetical protein
MIGPGGLLLVVPHLFICCPSFSFMGGVAKEYITKLGCEIYFHYDDIVSTAGDALKIANLGPSVWDLKSRKTLSYILKQTWCLSVCVFVTDIRGLWPGQPLRGARRGVTAFYTSRVDA